ncbi:MAG: sigma-70 family RNA polymerase sigma factor [Planctomycetota bacterium]
MLEAQRERLVRVARRFTRDREAAEDLVHEAWLSILSSNTAPKAPSYAYLFTVVTNLGRRHLQRRARSHTSETYRVEDHASTVTPLNHLTTREQHGALGRAIQSLPEHAAQILALRYAEGMAFEEIATTMGRPSGTVRSTHKRTIDRLRVQLKRALRLPGVVGTLIRGAILGRVDVAAVFVLYLGACGLVLRLAVETPKLKPDGRASVTGLHGSYLELGRRGLLPPESATTPPLHSPAVFNGDFEDGNRGFQSGAGYVESGAVTSGQYSVRADELGSAHWRCRDHTSGHGRFLICNGEGENEGLVWAQTVSVTDGQTYQFQAWAANLTYPSQGKSEPILELRVSGTPIGASLLVVEERVSWSPHYVLRPLTRPSLLSIEGMSPHRWPAETPIYSGIRHDENFLLGLEEARKYGLVPPRVGTEIPSKEKKIQVEERGMWLPIRGTFAAKADEVRLEIWSTARAHAGNDFGIDDISLRVVPETDGVPVIRSGHER